MNGFAMQEFYKISIHALREEGDPTGLSGNGDLSISIHALREEGDVRSHP